MDGIYVRIDPDGTIVLYLSDEIEGSEYTGPQVEWLFSDEEAQYLIDELTAALKEKK